MGQILEFGNRIEDFRSEILLEVAAELGLNLQWKFSDAAPELVRANIDEEFRSGHTDQIRLTGWAQEVLLGKEDRQILEFSHVGVVDAVVLAQSKDGARPAWWPRNFILPAFRKTLAQRVSEIDLGGSGMIIGATPLARVGIVALSAIGIRRFIVSDPSFDLAESFIAKIQRTLFGLELKAIKETELTQLPSVCSFALNTLHDMSDGLSREVSYFNFLKPGGYWMDFGLNSNRKVLREEILSTKSRVESPALVWTHADADWLEACYKVSGAVPILSEKYQQFIDKVGLSSS